MVPRRLSRVVKELRGLLATAPAPVATLLSEGARQLTQQLAHHYGAHALACSHAVGLGKAAVLRCGVTVAAEEGLASVGGLVLQRSSWAVSESLCRVQRFSRQLLLHRLCRTDEQGDCLSVSGRYARCSGFCTTSTLDPPTDPEVRA